MSDVDALRDRLIAERLTARTAEPVSSTTIGSTPPAPGPSMP